MRTSSLIARKLTDMGVDEVLVGDQVCKKDARMGVPSDEELEKNYQRAVAQGGDPEFLPYTKGGMTGVIGIIKCGEGPTVAMRFDIDALGVIEAKDSEHRPVAEGFTSVNEGMMHACGHDAHATIGLGVAKVLMGLKDQLHGTIKLIFQPAEEGVRGAKSIVENGHLDGVDYCIGSHVSKLRENEPAAALTPGCYGSLATTKFDVYFHGVSAHAGGAPQKGNNVMLTVATAIMNLYAIPRHSGGTTRINVGTVTAGSGRNVIADIAKMEIELRGETTEINDYVVEYATNVIESAAK
ncbi:MAG: amidohydrolase, partial [Eubacterium sp.]|nr:amidohydrolase [Eubacterium sp.]